MKAEIYIAKPFGALFDKSIELNIDYIGFAEVDEFDEDKLWEMCNWAECGTDKPSNLKADIGSCCSNVVFKNPENNKYYIAKGFGWKVVDTMEEVKNHFENYLTENFK